MCLDRPRDPLPTRVEACPPLAAAFGEALAEALTGLGVGLDRSARAAIAWNEAMNLTAIRDPEAIAIRHVADSLTALDVLASRHIDRFVDLGSGGGFPGLPIAAALPADRALVIDSVAKKVRFLATAIDATGLGGRVAAMAGRAETLAADRAHRERWPAVTARAVAGLGDLIELAFPLLRPGGILVAWKRGDVDDAATLGGELDAARRALDAIDPQGLIDIVESVPTRPADAARHAHGRLADLAGHRLVVVQRGRTPIGGAWPRDPALRQRHPW